MTLEVETNSFVILEYPPDVKQNITSHYCDRSCIRWLVFHLLSVFGTLYVALLTHLFWVVSSTLMFCISPFQIRKRGIGYSHNSHALYKFLYFMQTVYTLIRRRVLRRLIWVYTVCQCPFDGALGIDGLLVSLYSVVCSAFRLYVFHCDV